MVLCQVFLWLTTRCRIIRQVTVYDLCIHFQDVKFQLSTIYLLIAKDAITLVQFLCSSIFNYLIFDIVFLIKEIKLNNSFLSQEFVERF